MIFHPTPLDDLYVIDVNIIADDRGWFARTFCKTEFAGIGHTAEWVQMNHSFTKQKGTIRGMHFQVPPYREVKLVRCIAGAVFDVAIDLRKGSETFLQSFAVELSAENRKMIYIPEGFAHGFQALQDNVELVYLHSEYYKAGFEDGVRYNDPKIQIEWPLPVVNLSERDKSHRLLDENFKGL